jgi:polyisoprenoid-binding protein YceI
MGIALALAAAGLASAQEVRPLQASGGALRVEVEKTRLMSGKKHSILFTSWLGELRHDPARPEASSLSVTIEAAEFRVEDTWVSEKDRRKIDEFTRSAAVLDVARHPRIHFEARGFRPDGATRWRIPGKLTVRGIAREVELTVEVKQDTAMGTAAFPMSAFGIRPPSAALGTVGTKDEMRVLLEIRGLSQASLP